MPYFFIDVYYWILVIPAVFVALWAQVRVKSTFHRYNSVLNTKGLTAEMVARQILDRNGLYSVRIERTPGSLSDHYDPRTNVVRLSDSTYGNTSVGALGVAAHEVGHALQYAVGYVPIKLRSVIIPISQIGSALSFPLILLGLIFSFPFFINAGILLFSAVVLFQLVTLPVEFNASRRALKTLEDDQILETQELAGAKKVLSAAAMTYLAAVLVSLVQLLRLILLTNRRR